MLDYHTAMEYHFDCLTMRRTILPSPHMDLVTSMEAVGEQLENLKDYRKAMAYYSEGLEMRRAMAGGDAKSAEVVNSLCNIGDCYEGLGDYEMARGCFLDALEMQRGIVGNMNHTGMSHSQRIALITSHCDMTCRPIDLRES
jgi:tetratricopeptide (TPR) repeat protein